MSSSLGKYSLGMGDRFAHQGVAQLRACQQARSELSVEVVPVWNKSNREHQIIGSNPQSTWDAAAAAIAELSWAGPYFVDADHIGMETVESFADCANFFTIDVADAIGVPAPAEEIDGFVKRHPELVGCLSIEGIEAPLEITEEQVRATATTFLGAVFKAGEIHRRIVELKGSPAFIPEVSMDETDSPQTPPELLVILAALAEEGVPLQTIAPKFTGRFNKGVDYAGDVSQFEQEFRDDVAVLRHATQQYGLPANLKLSVHSGSDKFSIYPVIGKALRDTGAGLHLKTAGTSWLEELIGLAEAGGDGLALAKEVYAEALAQREALCEPYATVIDVDPTQLPSAEEVNGWSSRQFQSALRHDPDHLEFNPHVRQLLHVGFKVAAKMGDRYLDLLKEHDEVIGRNVTENLFDRHLRPIFA